MDDEQFEKEVAGFIRAVRSNDEREIAAAALPIILDFFRNMRRIADATEKLASFELHRVGDIVTAAATKK